MVGGCKCQKFQQPEHQQQQSGGPFPRTLWGGQGMAPSSQPWRLLEQELSKEGPGLRCGNLHNWWKEPAQQKFLIMHLTVVVSI